MKERARGTQKWPINFVQTKKNANLSFKPRLCSFVLTQFESGLLVLPYVAHHATFVTKLPLRTEKQKYPCRYEIYIIALISPTTIKNERLYFQYFNIDGA